MSQHKAEGQLLGAEVDLLRALVLRELKSKYRGSYFGWAWALVRPFVQLAIYGLVVGVFLGAARSIPDFMVFVFVGLMAWNLFLAIVNGSVASIISSAALITKAKFPRILLPLANLIVALVDTSVQFLVLIVAFLVLGEWPTMSAVILLPVALLVLIAFGLGLGLLVASFNVYVRDVGYLTDVGLQVGFWTCPIVYSYGLLRQGAEAYGWPVDLVANLYLLNPMANVVLGFQSALWPAAQTPEADFYAFPEFLDVRLLILFPVGLLFLAGSSWIFARLSRNFAQEL